VVERNRKYLKIEKIELLMMDKDILAFTDLKIIIAHFVCFASLKVILSVRTVLLKPASLAAMIFCYKYI